MRHVATVSNHIQNQNDRPKVSEYNKKDEEMTEFDPSLSLSLNDQLTQINEQMGVSDRGEELCRCLRSIDVGTSERYGRYSGTL